MGKARIDSSQLVILLILSRIFTLLTFSSHARGSRTIYIEMVGCVGAVILQLIVLIPTFILLKRNKECGIIECSFKVNKYYGIAVTTLYLLLMIFQVSNTTSSFEFFMTTAIYPTASAWVFILFFILAVSYAAYMGLEAFSRMGGFVAIAVMVGTVILVLSNWSQMNLVYFQNPFHDGIMPVLESTYQQANVSLEIILYLLLIPYVKADNVVKPLLKFFVTSVIYFEVIIFAVLISLGNLADSEMFPIFTMAIISEMAFLERLDAIYMGIWIFIAFIRTATLVFISSKLIRDIMPQKINSDIKGIVICSLTALALSVYLSRNIDALTVFSQVVFGGVIMLVFVIAIPILTLILTRKKSGVQSK